jgi:UDP:flavonoid glycosyltransferase YjiC (YdhE family)
VAVVASFVGGWGHAEPLVEVVQLAAAKGHVATFAGQRAVLPRLEALGFDTVVVGPDTLSVKRIPLQPVDRALERTVMREHFVGRYGRQRAASLTTLLRDIVPAALICDEVDFGALLAAELLGIPSVTLNVIAAGRVVSAGVIGEAWNALRVEVGLDPDPDGIHLGGTLALAPFPASFRDPALPRLPQWRPVCPTTIPARTERRGVPLVYATLGTVFNVESGDLLARVVAGLGMTDVDALVTVGPNIGVDEFPGAASHVRIEQFVAQRKVLGRCEAVVCHGGSGTLMAALSFGVPVVVIPMGADQPDNADRCEELGCGVVLDALEATPADIAGAIHVVTSEPRFARSAQRLADEVTRQPALDELPELVALLSP